MSAAPPRRSARAKNDGAVSTAATSVDWFSTKDLMSPTEFEKIKHAATRDQVVQKLNLLGIMDPAWTKLNGNSLKKHLRVYLGAQQPAPPTKGTKRTQSSHSAPGKRRKVEFLPAGDTSDAESDETPVQIVATTTATSSVDDKSVLSGAVSHAFHSMGATFLRPDQLQQKLASDKALADLYRSSQWTTTRSIVPGALCVVAALCLLRKKTRLQQQQGARPEYIPFESLRNDGYAVFRLCDSQTGVLGNGVHASFSTLEFVHWEPGTNPFSSVDGFFGATLTAGTTFEVWDESGKLTFLTTTKQVSDNLSSGLHPKHRNSDPHLSSTNSTSSNFPLLTPAFEQLPSFTTPSSSDKNGGMKSLSYDFDGKLLKYFNKIPDLATKMKDCRIILRLAEPIVFTAINQGKGELDIELDDAFQVLISSGNAWSGPVLDGERTTTDTSSCLPNTKRYNLLCRIPSLMRLDVFKTLLTMGWACSKDGFMSYSQSVSLATFSSDPANFNLNTSRKEIFMGAKTILVEALTNLEHYLIFAFGCVYERIFEFICHSLQFGDWADQKWDMGYTRYSIEMVLFVTFNEIKNIPKSSYVHKSPINDISTPSGIYNIIVQRFKILKPSIERVTEFQRIFSDTTQRLRLFGGYETASTNTQYPHSNYTVRTQQVPTSRLDRNPSPAATQWCVYDVYRQAGLTNPKTGEAFTCVHGPSCTFRHGDFTSLPRKEQQQLINKWATPTSKGFPRTPPTIAQALTTALDKLRPSNNKQSRTAIAK